MSTTDGSAGAREFIAAPGFFGLGPNYSAARSYAYMYGALAVMVVPIAIIGVLNMGGHHIGEQMGRLITPLIGLVLVLAGAGFVVWYWRHNRQQIRIYVDSEGLRINKRPGDVFRFADARLGLWGVDDSIMGTVLHLYAGSHRFVLGGRDHRVGSQTRIDEPPVPGVDAWLWAPVFDELLSMAGPQSGVDVRAPNPNDPIRCLLFPNPMLAQQMGGNHPFKVRQLMDSATHASLAIDVDPGGLRAIDPRTGAVIASAARGQVAASPAVYQYQPGWGPYTEQSFIERGEARLLSVTTEMIIGFPGMQELTIACRDGAGVSETNSRRFDWAVPAQQRVNEPAQYAVSGADWLVLVEAVGLSPYLVRNDG